MYLSSYKKICELFNTMYEGILYCLDSNKSDNDIIVKDCASAIEVIKNKIKIEKNIKTIKSIDKLESITKKLNHISRDMNNREKLVKDYSEILCLLENTFNYIQQTTDVKFKIAFLPYKAAMWTALESVWQAAEQDPDCTTVVMPIPYIEVGDGEGKITYEGDNFPDYVPITNYEKYNLDIEKPDIIYIHNPYDDTNTITSVPMRYFSKNLAKVTDMLVYIPYFIFGPHNNFSSNRDIHYIASATRYANKIIAQSKRVKELFEQYGQESNKVVALGSPKSDAVIRTMQNPCAIPKEWHKKLKGKKVFLLNTHISNIPRYGQVAIEGMEKVLNTVINNENCALIWRPHPLSETMIKAYSPEYIDKFNNMKKMISKASNGIIDEEGSYLPAFSASDAMLSTYSSLIREYMITEKPILIVQQKRSEDKYINSPVDIFCNYFIGPEKKEIQEFIDMVICGEDPKKDERISSIRKGLLNLDGTCGEKVHEYIKRAVVEQM